MLKKDTDEYQNVVQDLIGVDEASKISELAISSIRAYLIRKNFPEPVGKIGKSNMWSREEVEHFARQRKEKADAKNKNI